MDEVRELNYFYFSNESEEKCKISVSKVKKRGYFPEMCTTTKGRERYLSSFDTITVPPTLSVYTYGQNGVDPDDYNKVVMGSYYWYNVQGKPVDSFKTSTNFDYYRDRYVRIFQYDSKSYLANCSHSSALFDYGGVNLEMCGESYDNAELMLAFPNVSNPAQYPPPAVNAPRQEAAQSGNGAVINRIRNSNRRSSNGGLVWWAWLLIFLVVAAVLGTTIFAVWWVMKDKGKDKKKKMKSKLEKLENDENNKFHKSNEERRTLGSGEIVQV